MPDAARRHNGGSGGNGGRLPPHHLEAERCTLGALLVDVCAASPVLQLLREEDFYLKAHQHVFRAVAFLYDQRESADVLMVAEHLRKENLLDEIGGDDYLLALAEEVPSTANALYYAQMVRDASVRRHLVATCTQIAREACEGRDDAGQLLDRAEQAIFEIAEGRSTTEFVHIPDLVDPVFDLIEKGHGATGGIATGFTRFDELTNGLHASELIIVAGRPSMGKTTFAMNIVQHVALQLGKPVGVFSLEVARNQVVQNLLCSMSGIDMQVVRRGKLAPRQWQDLIDAADRLRAAPIYIDDSPVLSTLELKAKARRLQARSGLQLLVVDYLQLMHNPGIDHRQEEISTISRGLKAAARELSIPVIAVSQLSRAVESRDKESHRPRLSDLRESGAIEQDADVVALLYREEYYKHDDPDVKGKADVIVAKQRNGPTGTVKLAFRGHVLRFENLAMEMEPSY